MIVIDHARMTVRVGDGPEIKLTEMGMKFLEAIMRCNRHGRAASILYLAQQVWDYPSEGVPINIKNNVGELACRLRKFGIPLKHLRGMGYYIEEYFDAPTN